jgi:hypothetical protein
VKEAKGNIWDLAKGHIVVITTNGFVKSNGECVMGKGIAAQAKEKYPGISSKIGSLIDTYNNRVFKLGKYEPYLNIWTMPVKPTRVKYEGGKPESLIVRHMISQFKIGDVIPGWACIADKNIIIESAKQIQEFALALPKETCVYLPRPGCGAGELLWSDIKPIIYKILGNNCICCSY